MDTATRDWTGNRTSAHSVIGARNYAKEERQENDFYATEPKMAEELLKLEPTLTNIWEPACGAGHLAEVFNDAGKLGKATDLYDRGYGVSGVDFLQTNEAWTGDIATNPPYKYAKEFALHALNLIQKGRKLCLFLKLTYLEGSARYRDLFNRYPPKTIYVSVRRTACGKNGDFKNAENAVCYAWYVWEKGYTGSPTVRWFNY